MNPLKDLRSEIKTFLVVTTVAVILAVGGILLLKTMQSGSVPMPPPEPFGTIECGGAEDIQCPDNLECVKMDPLPGANGICVSAESPVSETANWQTYRNEDFGFEVRYPNNWKEKSEKTRSILVAFLALFSLGAERA